MIASRALVAAAALLAAAGCSRGDPQAGRVHAADAPPVAAQPQAGAELCTHRVPAALCTRCNPDLAPVFKEQGDWCAEHGVPESQCLKCNPGLTFTATAPKDWCKEHAVPESKCTKCNPKLVARFVEAGDYCREHGYPASVCPLCHPEQVEAAGEKAPVFPDPGTLVRLASVQTAVDAGIQTRRAQPGRIARVLEVVGQLTFDQNRLAQLSARSEALVAEVKVDVGDEVKEGQVLAVLASSAVGADQARLSASRARVEAAQAAVAREQQLAESGLSPRRSVEEARRELSSAEADAEVARSALGAAGAAPGAGGGRYALRAPFAGTVVARDAVAGRAVPADQILLQVADLSTVWAQLEIPEADAGWVRPGQEVRIQLEGQRGTSREATITRVAAAIDPSSRTVRARVELPNRDRSLKAGAFLRAQVRVTSDHDALLVPAAAVQRAEGRSLVFVRKGPSAFEPRVVETGEVDGDRVDVLSGLRPGDEVVTTGAFLLKTEIMKWSIGAGCCDLEEKK